MRGISSTALRAMFSTETTDAVILLLTIYDPKDNETELLHLADNFTGRLADYTTDTDVVYGVTISGTPNSLGTIIVKSSEYNSTQNTLDSYFKINGTTVNYTFSRGHTLMVLNPYTFAIEGSITTYDTYGAGNSQQLLQALRNVPSGKLVCIGSFDATSLDQSTRDYINMHLGCTRTDTWMPTRTAHTVIGIKDNPIYLKPTEIVSTNTSTGLYFSFSLSTAYNTSGSTVTNSNFIYFPMQITLPSETDDGTSNCSIQINYITQDLIKLIRQNITSPTKILLQVVLASNPGLVEASYSNFYITGVSYDANSISLQLGMINYSVEPFPAFNFSPKYFPGLF